MPPQSPYKAAHSGFETQGRRHQKSKTGPTIKESRSPKISQKIKIDRIPPHLEFLWPKHWIIVFPRIDKVMLSNLQNSAKTEKKIKRPICSIDHWKFDSFHQAKISLPSTQFSDSVLCHFCGRTIRNADNYRPLMKLREGNVFTHVRLSTGDAWRGVCVVGEHAVQGHVWQGDIHSGGMHGWGVCGGGMHRRGHAWRA